MKERSSWSEEQHKKAFRSLNNMSLYSDMCDMKNKETAGISLSLNFSMTWRYMAATAVADFTVVLDFNSIFFSPGYSNPT